MNKLAQEAIDKAYQSAIAELFKGLMSAYTSHTEPSDRSEALGRVNQGIAIAVQAKKDMEKLI